MNRHVCHSEKFPIKSGYVSLSKSYTEMEDAHDTHLSREYLEIPETSSGHHYAPWALI